MQLIQVGCMNLVCISHAHLTVGAVLHMPAVVLCSLPQEDDAQQVHSHA